MAIKLAVGLIDAAAQALEARRAERARRRAADRAYDTRRPHLWCPPRAGETLQWCAYCKNEQTDTNAFALCPATGDRPQ